MNNKILELQYEIKYKLIILEDIKNRMVLMLINNNEKLSKDFVGENIKLIENKIKKQRLFENFFESFKVKILNLIEIKTNDFVLKLNFNNSIKNNLFISKFIEIPFFNFTKEVVNIKDLKKFHYILLNEYIIESNKIKNINNNIKQLKKISNKILDADKNTIKQENTIKNINQLVNKLITNITY